jgi:long-chain acyl-CoA synthetase
MLSERLLDAIDHAPSARPALRGSDRTVAYGELASMVKAERRWLNDMGIRRCALLADNSWRWAIADLALLGNAAIGVPIPDSFTAAQRQHVLDDAGIDCVMTDRGEAFVREHPTFSAIAVSPVTGLSFLRRDLSPVVRIPVGAVKVTYTSGSTGTPKGVCLSAGAIDAVVMSLAAATADLGLSRHLCVLPLATLLENIAGLYVPLLLGAEIVLQPGAEIGMSYAGLQADMLLAALARHEPNSLVLVPEMLRLLVQAARSGWHVPASFRFIAVGGASVAPSVLEQADALGLPAFEGYGLSECASVVCLNTPKARRPGSVGRPLPHARVRIDASGEICVGGTVMSGYLGAVAEDETEIRTGDLGEFDRDGFLYVRGRAKNLFITSMGRNITPEWVECELLAEPAISQAMALGEGRAFVSALIVPSPQADDSAIEAALARANARLPDYARVRQWTRFPERPTYANDLLTANGRLRRAAIQSRCAASIATLYESQESFLHDLLSRAVSA